MSIGIFLWILFIILAVYGYTGIAWFFGLITISFICGGVFHKQIEKTTEGIENFVSDLACKIMEFIVKKIGERDESDKGEDE